MGIPLDPDARIVLVCRGGPENGPFSAMAARILFEKLNLYGFKVSAIYASSGSTPTALLGCTGELSKLCNIWANIKPEDIVGKVRKGRAIYRILRRESILTSKFLGDLIRRSWNLDRIFSSSALPIKFPAVDILSNEYIIFSNKNPGHKKWFDKGVLGSMGLVPFLPPQMVFDPEAAGLIESGKSILNALLLIDGGFKGNMLLEEAMRDQFDVIFLIDVHDLRPTSTDLSTRYHWTSLLRTGLHILSNTNDVRQFQMADRINEEIRIKNELLKLIEQLPDYHAPILRSIISRMDEGRLRLGDKKEARIIIVSNPRYSTLFNFAKFTEEEVITLLSAGEEASNKVLERLGLD